MKVWEYTERPQEFKDLPEVPRVVGQDPFVVRHFPLPDRRRVYLSNGVIGLRLPAVPFLGAEVMVNGLTGRSSDDGVEGAAPAPFPVAADIVIGHNRLSQRPDLVHVHEQALDMSFGELTTRLEFRADSVGLAIEVLTFLPRSLPTVICQQVTMESDGDCELRIESILDPHGLPGRCLERRVPQSYADGVLWWETRGALSCLGAALQARLSGAEEVTTRRNDWGKESESCVRSFSFKARSGKRVTLRQIGSLVPCVMHHEPHWQALRMVAFGWYQGFDWLRYENRRAWAELWRGRPVVATADSLVQRVLDSAFFYIHCSIHPSSPCSIAPFGLSHAGTGYYNGHIFIDTEHYMFPPLLLTAPDSARAVLDYRSRLIGPARMNAACMGYKGIMFPWQSANVGCEVTRGTSPSCVMEFSSPAIAVAFMQYAHASGDPCFAREQAWPVLSGVADWIVSRLTRTPRGLEVRNLVADENFVNTHNDPKISRSFIELLRAASDMARDLGLQPPGEWSKAADNIVVLTRQEDILRETAHRKKAPPLTRETLREVMGDIIGIPISAVGWVVRAVELGDRKQAAEIWREDVLAHWEPDFGLFREWGTMWNYGVFDQDCFLTYAGHLLKQAMLDLPRIRISKSPVEQWCSEPVVLPEGWDSVEVERIWLRGRPARLVARQGAERAAIEWQTDET